MLIKIHEYVYIYGYLQVVGDDTQQSWQVADNSDPELRHQTS